MTTRKMLVLGALAALLMSFPLRMEWLSIVSALSLFFLLQPTKEELAEEERAKRAAEVAHAHSMAYQTEIARAMARREAEEMGIHPDDADLRHVHPEYQRATPKSRTSKSKAVREFH